MILRHTREGEVDPRNWNAARMRRDAGMLLVPLASSLRLPDQHLAASTFVTIFVPPSMEFDGLVRGG